MTSLKKKYKYVIIGAGPCGLGAAYRLKELGITDFLVIDRNEYIGGLATTHVDENGFLWDVGGHVQFSHYKYFDEVMKQALGEEGWNTRIRESWVWMYDRFVPYPFQNNIRYLPKESMWKCMEGIIHNYKHPITTKPKNFEEWIYATFGKGIAEEFLMPYNYKVWAYPPADMNYTWIGERVAVTDLERVARNVIWEEDDVAWGPNSTFQFPKKGGTGAIWKSVGENLIGKSFFHLGADVERISSKNKSVHLSDGNTVEFDHILSTVPIDKLTHLVDECGSDIQEKAAGLKYSNTNVVGIGLKGKVPQHLADKCWLYYPEQSSPYYRVTVFSNYSKYNVPDPENNWSLMVEVSESSKKEVNQDKLMEDTIQALINDKMIESESDIVSKFHVRYQYGYPTPSVERNAILDEVQPHLENLGVFSRGRFGAWKYEVSNQDHSMMQGVEWANRMALGIPELTLPHPGTANAMWGKNI